MLYKMRSLCKLETIFPGQRTKMPTALVRLADQSSGRWSTSRGVNFGESYLSGMALRYLIGVDRKHGFLYSFLSYASVVLYEIQY